MRGRRRAVVDAVAGVLVVLCLCVSTASAHEYPASSAGGVVSVWGVVLFAVGLSLLGGFAVAQYVSERGRAVLVRAVGGLLVVLGGSTVAVALTERAVVGGVAAVVGVGFALAVAHRHRLGGCADATFGAVLIHRVLEGALLATAATTGLAFGLVGAVVFAGHAAAETCAVGGLYATDTRERALLAIGLVQVAFVGGALVGGLAVRAVPLSVRVFVFGLVGGILLTVGVVELRAGHADPPLSESSGHVPNH
jgi:hypothetical protein